jgi:hypothetical protein
MQRIQGMDEQIREVNSGLDRNKRRFACTVAVKVVNARRKPAEGENGVLFDCLSTCGSSPGEMLADSWHGRLIEQSSSRW